MNELSLLYQMYGQVSSVPEWGLRSDWAQAQYVLIYDPNDGIV